MIIYGVFYTTYWMAAAAERLTVSRPSIVSLAPNISDAVARNLLPTHYKPIRCSIDISGVSTALVNGLRRTIISEMPVAALNFRDDDFQTSNPFILIDMIRQRIRQIPLDQSVSPDATFKIDVTNDALDVIEIKSADIIGKSIAFNQTFTVCTLEPKSSFRIKRIFVEKGLGYQYAGFSVAFNAVVIPLDQTPIINATTTFNGVTVRNDIDDAVNNTDRRGISSSVSNPRSHRLAFSTNGTMPPSDILKAGCENLIQRLNRVLDIIDNIVSSVGNHTLVITAETDTIGNILVKTICELYPDIGFVTYISEPTARECTLRIKTDTDVAAIITTAVKHAVGQITGIMKQI